MILDSTFVHDLVRKKQVAVDKLDAVIETDVPVALSAITVFEVGIGLRGGGAQYREQFNKHIDALVVLSLDESASRRALHIQRELLDRGEPIGARDVLIAGTAAESADPTVLTRNVDEFERVDSITVEPY
jgi:tRNA(fMet)-specific endonuclease VapC